MHKTYPARIKATGPDDGLAEGQFRALVSVFGNKDAYGDVVVPGAFTETLQEWGDSGDSIPVYWSHQMNDPDLNIGYVVEAEETDQGLEVLAQLDLDAEASPKARQAYRLLKGRRVTQFSFAYDVVDGGPVEKDGDSYNELRKLRLYEVGPTPIGANPATELLAVKAQIDALTADVKAGRVLSAKNESTLREALAALQDSARQIKDVLAAVSSETDGKAGAPAPTQEQARESGTATDKEPPAKGATAKEPSRRTPVAALAAHLTLMDKE